MMRCFTREQLVEMAVSRLGFVPMRADCDVDLSTGCDVAGRLGEMIDSWYLEQLDCAPLSQIPVDEMADKVSGEMSDDGGTLIELPEECRRAVSVCLTGWVGEVPVLPYDSRVVWMMRHPYLRASSYNPVAMMSADGRSVVGWPAGDVKSLRCVAEPADGLYRMDEALISTFSIRGISE